MPGVQEYEYHKPGVNDAGFSPFQNGRLILADTYRDYASHLFSDSPRGVPACEAQENLVGIIVLVPNLQSSQLIFQFLADLFPFQSLRFLLNDLLAQPCVR